MASFNDPKVTNPILDDVGTIQQLLSYLAQMRPDFADNVPKDSIRLVATDSSFTSYVLQKYSGSAWAALAELQISVTKLKGYAPSTSAVANTIPVYNANGQLVGNITGNAPTATKLATPRSIQVGGILSSTATNFDGTGNITIPVNQVTINNSADNAVNGVLTFAHGGTGRTDGASQDVVVPGTSSNFLAKAYGQLGQAKVAAAGVNVNTLIERGLYILQGNMTVSHNLPENTGSNITFMEVYHQGVYICQIWRLAGRTWQRYSTNKGASFGPWYVTGTINGSISIYISKSGSDNNSGLSNSYPVLTLARAMQIADNFAGGNMNTIVYFRFGEGNWSGLNFYAKPYIICIQPYDGANATAYSASLPVFEFIDFVHCKATVGTVVVTSWVRGRQCSMVDIVVGYKRFGRILAEQNSHVNINSQNATTNVLDFTGDGSNPCIAISNGATMYIGYHNIGLRANITASQFLYVYANGAFMTTKGCITVALNGFTFTGKKFSIEAGAFVTTREAGTTAPADMTKLPGTAAGTYANGAIVNGYSIGQAVDANVVHKGGDTMTGDLTVTKVGPNLITKYTDVVKGTAPSANHWASYVTYDKNGAQMGNFYNTVRTDGSVQCVMNAQNLAGTVQILAQVSSTGGFHVSTNATPAGNSNNTAIPTTAWVRTLLNSNSANEVPVGTVCYYTGAFTRAIDAAVYFARQIDKLDAQLKDEKGAARMLRMTRASEEETSEQAIALGELESNIFKLEFMKEFFLDMESRVPENDGVTLYNAAGDPIQEEAPGYPEFYIDDGIESYAFPNTKWNEYKDAAGRVVIGEGTGYTLNATGGSATHTHTGSGSLGSYTLSVSTIPSHGHTYTGRTSNGLGGNTSGNGLNTTTNQQTGYTGSSGSHTHSLTVNSTGSSSTLQPYRVLRLIKKVA